VNIPSTGCGESHRRNYYPLWVQKLSDPICSIEVSPRTGPYKLDALA
jgi:hypothetical protein